MRRRVEQSEVQLRAQYRMLEGRLAAAQRERDDLLNEASVRQESEAHLLSVFEALESQCAAAQSERDELRRERDELIAGRSYAQLRVEYHTLEHRLSAARKERDTLRRERDELQERKDVLLLERKEERTKREKAEAELRREVAATDNLRAELSRLKAERTSTAAELVRLRARVQEYETADRRKRNAEHDAQRTAERERAQREKCERDAFARMSGRWDAREKMRTKANTNTPDTSSPPPRPPVPPPNANPLARYNHHWDSILSATGTETWRFTFATFPWPAPAPDKITRKHIADFFGLASMDATEQKQMVRQQLLRWHPDKFDPRGTLNLIVETDREAVKTAQGEVVLCLNYWLESAA